VHVAGAYGQQWRAACLTSVDIVTNRRFSFLTATAIVLVLACSAARASLIYTYDFPGSPGSGLAGDQSNGQPTGATFSDFTRNTVTQAGGGSVFVSDNWSTSGSLDPTYYEGFSITASAGFHLNLSSFTFDAKISGSGPLNVEAALFLNGSATAYATYDFAPNGTLTPYTFNFTPLTDMDNVTLATIKFFGWNAASSSGNLTLDDVSTFGDISTLPEFPTLLPILFVISCCVCFDIHRRRKTQH
jgi:hypothetical protein